MSAAQVLSAPAPKRPLTPHRWGAVHVAACVIPGATWALLVVTATLALQQPHEFDSPVAGALAFDGGSKIGDLLAWPCAVAVGLAVGQLVSSALRLQPTPEAAREAAGLALVWSLPAVIAMGSLVAGARLPVVTTGTSAIAVVVMALYMHVGAKRGVWFQPRATSVAVLGSFLWALLPLTLMVTQSRVHLGGGGLDLTVAVLFPAVTFTIAAGAHLFLAMHRPARFAASAWTSCRLPQILSPLLFLALLPSVLVLPDGERVRMESSGVLAGLLALLVALSVAGTTRDLYRRTAPGRSLGERLARPLSPWAAFPILLLAILGTTRAPVITTDDYHFGESLVGVQNYRSGDLPYDGHVPAHGVVQDDLAAILNALLYDGTAASQTEALRLSVAVLAAFVFVACLIATRSLLLAATVTAVGTSATTWSAPGSGASMWAFLIALSWLFVSPSLRRRPGTWLTIWLVMWPLVVLAAPAQGVVFYLASSVLAVRSVVTLVRGGHIATIVRAGLVGVVVLGAVAATPVQRMVEGAIGYVSGNASLNLVAYGIPWEPRLVGGSGTPIVLDALRMAWVLGLASGLAVVLREARRRKWTEELSRAVFVTALLLGLLPYVMGRIDPGHPSRVGYATIFVAALVVPVLFWRRLTAVGRRALLLVTAAVTSGLFGQSVLAERVVLAAVPVASPALIDGTTYGLPGWGLAAAEDETHLVHTAQLSSLLAAHLADGAPYYDATSRNAQYAYLGRAPVVSVPAAYNSPSESDQRRTVAELRKAKPELAVLLQPHGNVVHDGGGLYLRTRVVAAYLEKAYVPYEQDGFIFGAREYPPASADRRVELPLARRTNATWDRGLSRKGAFVDLADSRAAAMLPPGTPVRLSDGSSYRIVGSPTTGGTLRLDSPPPTSFAGASIRSLTVETADLDQRYYHAWLFERAMGQRDLGALPSSWGRTATSMGVVGHHRRTSAGGVLTRRDAQSWIDISLNAKRARPAFLSFAAACRGGKGRPVLAVTWRADGLPALDSIGLSMTLAGTRQLVPLDASAYWRAAGDITGLSIRVTDFGGCDAVEIADVATARRMGS